MKTVWITRTDTEKPTQLPVGWQAIKIPLLQVAPAPTPPSPPLPGDVLIFTSGNAVLRFCEFTNQRNWPVYTVGDTTAKQAQDAGFEHVVSAGKDVAKLRELIRNSPSLKSHRLYYASGRNVSGNLEADLNKDGYIIERQVLYETHAIREVPPPVAAILAKKLPLTVCLYSPKGAQTFRSLDLNWSQMETISISANVDKKLEGLRLKSRKIAKTPTHAAIIKQLG